MGHRLVLAGATAFGSVVALGGCGAAVEDVPPAAQTAQPGSAVGSGVASYRSTRSHTATPLPVGVRIPAIGVDSGLEDLTLAEDQTIEVPKQPSSAGWWVGGPRPGQVGPAVILGHVDSRRGPAVFFRLGDVELGDEVLVDRADGTTVRFLVTQRASFQKAAFPSELVYYPTLEPELRLVTCGGPIDPATGHYRDNLVLFAAQA